MMAITTLERCYDNPNVFRSIVKIRKGEAVKIVERANSIAEVKQIFAKSIYKVRLLSLVDTTLRYVLE